MTYSVKPTGASCGAVVEGLNLSVPLAADLVSELREHWVNNKLLIFPDQNLTPDQLVAFSKQFGDIGEDPFFGHIDEHEQVAAIQRNADETTQSLLKFSIPIGVF